MILFFHSLHLAGRCYSICTAIGGSVLAHRVDATTRRPRMGAAERWKVPQANLQKAKQIGDSRHSLALGTAPYSAGKVTNLTMFEQQLECDVFKKQVFGRTKNSREALLLFFCHRCENSLTQ
jgi:hypothetical protein